MKIKSIFLISFLFVSLFCFHRVSAFSVPEKPKAFVNDYAGVLSGEEKNSLENKISSFEKNTSNEIAVVTVPSLDGDTIENLAQEIFSKWGIGKSGKNNGVLMLVAMAEHKTRIHTGYGVEGELTDLATSYIQSEVMVPAFKNGDYYSGINGAVDKIIESLGGQNVVPEGYSNNDQKVKVNWEFILAGIFFIFQWVASMLARSKSWWAGGVLGGVIGGIILIFGSLSFVFSTILFIALVALGLGLDFFVSKAYQKAKISGNRFPWWIGGGGFGGRSGGGFGGFGGGMSGGGGSSSSW